MTSAATFSQKSAYSKKNFVIAIAIISLTFSLLPVKTHAAVLNRVQIQAVADLLSSFSTNSATVQSITSALLGATTSGGAPVPVDVFLIAGQSNALGIGDRSQSPLPPAGKVLQYCESKIYDAVDPVCGAYTGSAWPQFGITYHNATGRHVAFVQTAVGATSMTVQADIGLGNWGPTTGSLFNASVSQQRSAMQAFEAAGYAPAFMGVLWNQGEADALAIETRVLPDANSYQSALINMIAQYRAQLGANMPFYIFRTGTQTNAAPNPVGYAQVRQAQQTVAATVPKVHEVFTDAVNYPSQGLMKDVWHFTQAGYNKMGMLGAQGVVANLPATPVVAPTVSYTTPGTYTFMVPTGLESLTVTVNGGGGPGIGCMGVYSSATPQYGTAGTASSFNGTVVANGGANDAVTAGAASGGDTNTTGGAGNAAVSTSYPQCDGYQHPVTSSGGRAVKTYDTTTLVPGSSVVVVVGAGGVAKQGGTFASPSGGNGSVLIRYTTAVAATSTPPVSQMPTCSLSAVPASISLGQSSVLTWGSTNATSVTLNGSAVSTSGTQTVMPSAVGTSTYTLNTEGSDGAVQCTATVVTRSAPILGSKNYTTPGTYTFMVPTGLESLTVTVNGGGGPGIGCMGVYSSATPQYGTAGTASSFNGTVVANGGANDAVTAGAASGGDTNTTGGAGNAAVSTSYPQCDGYQHPVTSSGGRAVKTYDTTTLVPGSSVVVVVGAGGVAKQGGTFASPSGGNGSVLIRYTTAVAANGTQNSNLASASFAEILLPGNNSLSLVASAAMVPLVLSTDSLNLVADQILKVNVALESVLVAYLDLFSMEAIPQAAAGMAPAAHSSGESLALTLAHLPESLYETAGKTTDFLAAVEMAPLYVVTDALSETLFKAGLY